MDELSYVVRVIVGGHASWVGKDGSLVSSTDTAIKMTKRAALLYVAGLRGAGHSVIAERIE